MMEQYFFTSVNYEPYANKKVEAGASPPFCPWKLESGANWP